MESHLGKEAQQKPGWNCPSLEKASAILVDLIKANQRPYDQADMADENSFRQCPDSVER